MKLRKDDMVKVIAGKDKGKVGRILRVIPDKQRVIVESVNMVKKHRRASARQQQGGIITQEAPLHFSNVAIFCTRCNLPSRISSRLLADGAKERYCVRCREPFKK